MRPRRPGGAGHRAAPARPRAGRRDLDRPLRPPTRLPERTLDRHLHLPIPALDLSLRGMPALGRGAWLTSAGTSGPSKPGNSDSDTISIRFGKSLLRFRTRATKEEESLK